MRTVSLPRSSNRPVGGPTSARTSSFRTSTWAALATVAFFRPCREPWLTPALCSREPHRARLHPRRAAAHRVQRRPAAVHADLDDVPAVHLVLPPDRRHGAQPRARCYPYVDCRRLRWPRELIVFCLTAEFGSALAIELRRAPPPDAREFLRFKFRNGTSEEFRTIHTFGHREDIPLTEFIYRLEVCLSAYRWWAR